MFQSYRFKVKPDLPADYCFQYKPNFLSDDCVQLYQHQPPSPVERPVWSATPRPSVREARGQPNHRVLPVEDVRCVPPRPSRSQENQRRRSECE